MFTLFKYILWLCMPYTIVLVLFMFIALWLFCRKQFRIGISLLLANALLVTISLPTLTTKLGVSLERKFPPVALKDIPTADAIVVLGGGLGAQREGMPYPECYPGADRVVMAARLYHAGKAKLIIPSGTSCERAEKVMLETMQIPTQVILCEKESRDTAENATKTMELLRERRCKKILLVTSSWHLPRALMLFKAPDMEFIPVGCDYEATLTQLEMPVMPMWMKLPSAAAAAQTTTYLKEYLGILFYSFKK